MVPRATPVGERTGALPGDRLPAGARLDRPVSDRTAFL